VWCGGFFAGKARKPWLVAGGIDFAAAGNIFSWKMELAALRHPFPRKKFPTTPLLCNKVDIVMEKNLKRFFWLIAHSIVAAGELSLLTSGQFLHGSTEASAMLSFRLITGFLQGVGVNLNFWPDKEVV